jgi:K+-transporting ATPase A subunit
MDLLHWTTKWTPEQWQTFGTMAAVFIAFIAALYARQQVRLGRNLRDEQLKPFVVVVLRPSSASAQAINLVVENIGKTLARNVKITFTSH